MSETPPERESVVRDTVVVHRSPRYLNFMLLGALLGVVAALVFTFIFPGVPADHTETAESGAEYSSGQIFGFLLFLFVPVGVALGGLAAIVIDRIISRNEQVVTAENVRTSNLESHNEADAEQQAPREAGPAVQPPTTEGPAS